VALEEALKVRVVHMVYVKKNGAMRDAHGTRASALIPEGYRAQGRRKASPLTLAYWDTDRGGWRCLLRNRLLGFIEVPSIPPRETAESGQIRKNEERKETKK